MPIICGKIRAFKGLWDLLPAGLFPDINHDDATLWKWVCGSVAKKEWDFFFHLENNRPGGSKTGNREFSMLVCSCIELVVTFHWLKLWTRTTKGKLSSTGISAGFMKPKSTCGIPVFLRETPDIIAFLLESHPVYTWHAFLWL